MAAVLEEMMESLALDESSSFYQDVDPIYEFDACKFFDFCVEETDYDAREAERWFRYARQYPPAPYIMKINLTNILKSIPANIPTNVHTSTSSSKLEADKHVSSTVPTPTSADRSMHSSEVKTEGSLLSENDGRRRWRFRDVQLLTQYLNRRDEHSAGSGLKHHSPIADDHIAKAKSKSEIKSPKPISRTFMKPTASHLAKQINMMDVHASGNRRSNKLETPTRSENEETKKQKLETGFLRKAAQLKHQTLFPHKMTTKAEHSETSSNSRSKITIPQKPKLLTEERAQRRRFRSQSKPEERIYTFKALPLNRKIFESPWSPTHKKNMPQYSPEFQKFQFKTSGMQH